MLKYEALSWYTTAYLYKLIITQLKILFKKQKKLKNLIKWNCEVVGHDYRVDMISFFPVSVTEIIM